MKIGLIQIQVSNCLAENLEQALSSIAACAQGHASLVLLPELWNTPFQNDVIRTHTQDWKTVLPALQQAAREHDLWILSGTLPVEEDGRLYNRAWLLDSQGHIRAVCDKLHLLEVHTQHHTYRESDVFTPGNRLCRVHTPWGILAICICYDVRFPELTRLLCEDAFLLAVPAGFNARVGAKHWQTLLQTRALENEVFTAGVNPAAASYGSYDSYGHSMVCDPDGQILVQLDGTAPWGIVDIEPSLTKKIRTRSPYWQCRRTDLYTLEENREKDSL